MGGCGKERQSSQEAINRKTGWHAQNFLALFKLVKQLFVEEGKMMILINKLKRVPVQKFPTIKLIIFI